MQNSTRRSAIQKITLGIAAGIILPQDFVLGKQERAKKKLGVALVGLGNYSTLQLAPALLETDLCYLAGIVTGSPEKARLWAEKYNIPQKNIYSYKNFEDIKYNLDIDIVYIVLPNFLHAEYTIKAAKAGKHVICEKPLAMNTTEAGLMIDACKKASVKLGVGYRLYYEPNHLKAIDLIAAKKYGQLKIVESSFGFTVPPPNSWRLNKKIGGGGAIMDLGVYAIQAVRRAVQSFPLSVTAQAFTFDKVNFKDIYETVFWQFEFPNGIVSHSSCSYSSYVDRFYLTCETGWIEIEPAFNAMGAKGKTLDGEMDLLPKKFQQVDQLDDFASAVINNQTPLASGEEGLIDLKLIEAILKAVKSGTKVLIS
jgi:predicted dehydrogenase